MFDNHAPQGAVQAVGGIGSTLSTVKRPISRIVVLTMLLMVSAAGTIVSTQLTASAAPTSSCYGSSCTDLDPSKTTCQNDAVTIWSTYAKPPGEATPGNGYGVLDMRYSSSCHANWVRFTAWGGIGGILDNLFALTAGVDARPWIWRDGVANYPRGTAGRSPITALTAGTSTWTAMITADGRTCMSADIYDYGDKSKMGGGFETSDLGNFTAGCIS